MAPLRSSPVLTPGLATPCAALPPGGAVPGLGRPGAGTAIAMKDQDVLILGLGQSGLAMARWCARCGANVTVADTRRHPPQLAALQRDLPTLDFLPGSFDAALAHAKPWRAIFKSPGLAPADVAAIAEAAQTLDITLRGELHLFVQALAELEATHSYRPKLLAVTGTNGKTTVTTLTAQLVARAGRTVVMAGNVGPTLLDTLIAQLAGDALPEVWVLELSSFQLVGASGFEPTAAALLNLTQDHLDWHGSMQHYAEAKACIFGQRALLVLNRDDAAVMSMLPEPVRVKLKRPQLRPHITFGAELPRRPGDFGLEEVDGMLWLVRALEADETARRRGSEPELHLQRLMPADDLKIRGRHNALNALAALALSQAAGCALGPTLHALRDYRGPAHRLESVGVIDQVEYFDDSKGTNVGATVAALSGLGIERRVVVILGGEGKGQDFSPLQAAVARYARGVVLIGRAAPQLAEVLASGVVPIARAESMAQAVAQARDMALPSDAVLLSPACASFDMFDNYEHRGRVFAALVGTAAASAASHSETVQ